MGEKDLNYYGYCPYCNARGISRERRIDGNDQCEKGCSYPSKNAMPTPCCDSSGDNTLTITLFTPLNKPESILVKDLEDFSSKPRSLNYLGRRYRIKSLSVQPLPRENFRYTIAISLESEEVT